MRFGSVFSVHHNSRKKNKKPKKETPMTSLASPSMTCAGRDAYFAMWYSLRYVLPAGGDWVELVWRSPILPRGHAMRIQRGIHKDLQAFSLWWGERK